MFDIAICDISIQGSFCVMLQVVHETIGLDDESKKVSYGSDNHEGNGSFLDKDDVKHQNSNGQEHFDAFIDVEPALFAHLRVVVFFHQGAEQGAQYHIEVGCHDHPVGPPIFLAEEAEQDAYNH